MPLFTTEALVWTIFAAVIAASVYAFAAEAVQKKAAKALLRLKADSPENAKSAEELGLPAYASFFIGLSSRIGKSIGKVVPETPKTHKNDLLFEKKPVVRYYLPQDALDDSLKKHLNESAPLWKLLVVLLLLLVAALVASTVIRFLTDYASGVFRPVENGPYGVEEQTDSLLEQEEAQNNAETVLPEQQEETPPAASSEEAAENNGKTETVTEETEQASDNID